jgi:hypothetical protein
MCIARPLEQAYLVVFAGDTPPQEVAAYLAGASAGSWDLELTAGGHFYRFERERAPVSVELTVATLSERTANDWLWSPVFCNGGDLATPTSQLLLQPEVGYSRADIDRVLIEERAGRVIDEFSSTYLVDTGARSGFAVIEAANRVHLRLEIAWAEPDLLLQTCSPQGPCYPLCPVLGPGVVTQVPTVGQAGLVLMMAFTLWLGLRRLS